jgi:phosphatidylglycerophosphate synthase
MIGETRYSCFSVDTGDRLARQLLWSGRPGRKPLAPDHALIAVRHVVVDDAALAVIAEHPDSYLMDKAGRPLIGFASPARYAAACAAFADGSGALAALEDDGRGVFIRTLRRRAMPMVIDLREVPVARAEKMVFESTYKGVTDIITGKVWPLPAFHVTRLLARIGIGPNPVTFIGIVLTFLAGWLFFRANWGWALIAAWLMTFLDTVDGKLARATVNSSRFGGWLDHANDVIHPPLWWACVALGLIAESGGDPDRAIWISLGIIALFYLLGRISEVRFHLSFGFNQFLWRPFDSALRRVISRRNIILLILTVGALLQNVDRAFEAAALWCAISIGLQCIRWMQAEATRLAGRPVENWMETGRGR